jgi:hypothetical protein
VPKADGDRASYVFATTAIGLEAEIGRPAIGRQDHLVVLPGPHEAQAPLPLVQFTLSRINVALHTAIIIKSVLVAARHRNAHIHGLHVIKMGRF